MKLHKIVGSLDAYCMLTTGQVEKKKLLFIAPYNHSEPISKLLQQFGNCQIIDTFDRKPYKPEQMMQQINYIIELMGVYDDEITE